MDESKKYLCHCDIVVQRYDLYRYLTEGNILASKTLTHKQPVN
jgi:hypothetical protein